MVLAVPDEAALVALHGPGDSLVREPDLDDEATALALLGGMRWPSLSSLPLAGRSLVAA